MTAIASARPAWEVADILREHGDAFRAKYGALLSLEQKQRCGRGWPSVAPPPWAVTYKRLPGLRPRTHRLQFLP